MERTPVNSSHLKSVGHDPSTNTLEVEFASGKTYQYTGVPSSDFHKLLTMPSAGNAFHRIIRSKATSADRPGNRPFKFRKVE